MRFKQIRSATGGMCPLWKGMAQFHRRCNHDEALSDLRNSVVCRLQDSIVDLVSKGAQFGCDDVDYKLVACGARFDQIRHIFHDHDLWLEQAANPDKFFKKGIARVFVVAIILVAD